MRDPHIDKELRYHFDRLVREYLAAGHSEAEARRRARIEFGGVEQIGEEVRDVRGRWLSDFAQDLRYAARTLLRTPAFLAVSVLSLALGIGANTVIFSLIDALMLRPLPMPEPSRVVQPTRIGPAGETEPISFSLHDYLRSHMKTVSAFAAVTDEDLTIVVDGAEEDATADLVTADFYRVASIQPAAGRLLQPSDDVISPAAPAAVLSYAYWQRRFGGNRNVIGRSFEIPALKRSAEIVGVAEARFTGAHLDRNPDITLPASFALIDPAYRDPRNGFLEPLARLAPGRTIEQADAELQVLWKEYTRETAPSIPEGNRAEFASRRGAVLSAQHGFSSLRDRYSKALLILMAIVALVLLLACANLSGLLLARAASRQREIAIRLSIGAGSSRLVRQFLTESLLLAALGGAAGFLLAEPLSRALVNTFASAHADLFLSTAPDWRVLVFTAAVSLAASVAAGLAPAVHALRSGVNRGLQQSRSAHSRMGRALVVAQLGLSMMLVVGAALFTGTLVKLYGVDPGIRTRGVLTFDLKTSDRYSTARAMQAIGSIENSLRRLPGVAAASAVRDVPLSGAMMSHFVSFQDPDGNERNRSGVVFNSVGADYFATISLPIVMGRAFDHTDSPDSPKVVIISQNLAHAISGSRSPIGRTLTSAAGTRTIVGVAANSLDRDLRHDPPAAMYAPWTQVEPGPRARYSFLIRTASGDPLRFGPLLDKLVRDADPGLRATSIQSYEDLIDRTIVTERILGALGGFFGLLALLIAGLGVFGLMTFQVSLRTNEIGVRMALGAARGSIAALVLREAAALALLGCALGAGAALTLTGLTRKLLFGVTPKDPTVFAIAALVLAAATLAAAWLPARRAAHIDPMTALRSE